MDNLFPITFHVLNMQKRQITFQNLVKNVGGVERKKWAFGMYDGGVK